MKITTLALAAALTLPLFAPCAVNAQDGLPEVHLDEVNFKANGVVNMPATEKPIDALRGRLIMVLFFSPWSDRVVNAVPHLNKLHDEFGGRALTIIGVTEGDPKPIEEWAAEHGVKIALCGIGTAAHEKLNVQFNVPGVPHSALIAPTGEVVWAGHPQALKPPAVRRHLTGVRLPPPVLPVGLSDYAEMLDDGRWGEARAALETNLDSLDKVSKQWGRGLIEWIDERRGTWLEDAAAHRENGWHWDAWDMYADFERRFSGLEGIEDANAKAAEIRADAEAKRDLSAGDDIVKAQEKFDGGNERAGELILTRVIRTHKKSRHADRAKAILAARKKR